jgi:hypothetical protein
MLSMLLADRCMLACTVRPRLKRVQDRQAVLLAKAANAGGLRLAGIRGFISCLLFDPVELLEEPERLFRRPAPILSGLECFTKRRRE